MYPWHARNGRGVVIGKRVVWRREGLIVEHLVSCGKDFEVYSKCSRIQMRDFKLEQRWKLFTFD